MAEAAEKLSGKLGLDTTDFKTGVQAANRELRVLESGFRAGVVALGDWSNSATGLEARVKSLTGQIDIQKLKVAALREEYERVKTEKGENSRAAQDLEIKLNKETETLGKMESELGQTEAALTEMSTATEESGEQAEEASQKHISFSEALKGVGVVAKGVVTAVIGLVAAVAAVGAAIGGLVFSSASAAAELVDLSAKTGISTTALQEMRFIGEQVGVSLDTIATSQARLTRSMASAAEGTGDAAKAFDELGVSVTNTDGSLRDQQDVMADVLAALGGIDNAAERDALAMQIFGRSAMELNPLIGLTADELARMKDEAHKLGAVMSEEDVAALEAFDDTIGALKLGLQGTLGTLSTIFLPGFQMVFGTIGGYLQRFAGIVENFGGTSNFIPGITGLITDIIKDVASQAPQMLTAGLSIVTSLLNAIMASLPTLLPVAIDMLLTLVDALLLNLPLLVDAALQIIIALTNGLAAAAPQLVPVIVQAIGLILQAIWDNAPALLEAGALLIREIAQGLVNAVPETTKQAITAFLTNLVLEMRAGEHTTVGLGTQIATNIRTGFESAIAFITGMVTWFWNAIKAGFDVQMKNLGSIGKAIVEGIWQGIKSQADKFYKDIFNFFLGIVDAVKQALGIESPSKVMFEQGIMVSRGFGLGVFDELNRVQAQMQGAFGQLQFSPAFASAGGGTTSSVVNNNGNSITINGLTFPGNDMQSITMADIMDFLNRR